MSGIALGGPPICAACRTLMHPPSAACPDPYVCLSGPECPDPRCGGIPEV